jgi:purine-binding chemotaxis protein CheW
MNVLAAAEIQRVLHQRALALGVDETPEVHEATIEVLVCRVGAERYAIDISSLLSVLRLVGVTPVPSASEKVIGVLNVRGELVAVLDLAAMLSLSTHESHQESRVLLADTSHGQVGIRVDEVMGTVFVSLDRLEAPLTAAPFVRGISQDCAVLLDLETLLDGQSFANGMPQAQR